MTATYDAIGGAYDVIGRLDVYHRLCWGVSVSRYRAFADAAFAACGAGTLLDAACGSMLFTAHAHGNCACRAIGVDRSLRMLAMARQRSAQFSASHAATLVHADVLSTPFAASTFDAIICMHVAHVLDDLDALLDELRRVLKPGGTLFLTSLVLTGKGRDRYLRFLSRAGIMAPPRRPQRIVISLRERLGAEPAIALAGNMLFARVTTSSVL
jgi:ubiquinone/menaquinone biosynthesis C-methylase UbiE